MKFSEFMLKTAGRELKLENQKVIELRSVKSTRANVWLISVDPCGEGYFKGHTFIFYENIEVEVVEDTAWTQDIFGLHFVFTVLPHPISITAN